MNPVQSIQWWIAWFPLLSEVYTYQFLFGFGLLPSVFTADSIVRLLLAGLERPNVVPGIKSESATCEASAYLAVPALQSFITRSWSLGLFQILKCPIQRQEGSWQSHMRDSGIVPVDIHTQLRVIDPNIEARLNILQNPSREASLGPGIGKEFFLICLFFGVEPHLAVLRSDSARRGHPGGARVT